MNEFLNAHPEVLNQIVFPLVSLVIGLLWAYVKRWEKLKDSEYQKALDCIAAGAQASYDEYVREIKKASADGSLTNEERKIARDVAVQRAIQYARDNGIDLVRTVGANLIPMFLERYILKMKGASAEIMEPELIR